MKMKLTRYYGDNFITKATLEIITKNDRVAYSCGAREPKFKNYKGYFAGCSTYCMPEGTYPVQLKSSESAPIALYIMHVPGHQKEFVDFSEHEKKYACRVLIGEETSQNPLVSQLDKCRETFEHFTSLLYSLMRCDTDIVFVVENKLVEITSEMRQEQTISLKEDNPFWDEF